MRQMWSSEQQWRKENSEQQTFNEERDEGGRGYDHWEREEDEEVVEEEEGYDLTPKHKIRTPIMEETESSVEQALRSRVGSRRLRREKVQGREGGSGDREDNGRLDVEEGGVDEEDMKLSLAGNVSLSANFLPTYKENVNSSTRLLSRSTLRQSLQYYDDETALQSSTAGEEACRLLQDGIFLKFQFSNQGISHSVARRKEQHKFVNNELWVETTKKKCIVNANRERLNATDNE